MAGGSSLASRHHGGHHLLHGGFGNALLGITLHLAVSTATEIETRCRLVIGIYQIPSVR